MPVVAVDAVLLVVGLVLVPETTGLGMVASTAMVISSDPDVHAAARTEHASVAASRRCGDGVFFADDQALRVGVGLVAVVLAGRRLIAKAELESAAVGRETGVVERALQLGGVLPQHRQRFRLFDREMRRHLSVAVDVDAHIDAAKLGRIEPDLETALAAAG